MSVTDVVFHKARFADDLRSDHLVTTLHHFINATTLHHFINSEAELKWRAAQFPPSWTGRQEAEDQLRVLTQSETFWISADMSALALAASKDMPDEPLLPYDLPATHGFMWLEQPFRMIEIRRKTISVCAFMWATRGGQVRVWHFSHRSDPDDAMSYTLRQSLTEIQWLQLPALLLNHVANLDFHKPLPRALTWDTPLPADAKMDIREVETDDGSMSLQFVTDEPMDVGDEPKMVRSPLLAFLLTVWRLCQQSLASRESLLLNSKLRRRLERANLPTAPVTVITLRRHGHSDGGSSEVAWSHRWIVRGHWRRQPCKDADGQWTTRHVYINPYLKGPDDKPLLIRQHVNALTR